MAKISEEFASKYLKAEDLNGKDLTLKITEAEIVQFDDEKNPGGKVKKVKVSFAKCEKSLILNVTNRDIITELYGDDTDDWIGNLVTLYPTKVQFGDKRVLAIRVREEAPAPTRKGKPEPAPVAAREPGEDDGEDEDNSSPF